MAKPPTKAETVANALGALILKGTYKAGDWLPAERELADQYEVDRSTVRRAVRMLAEQELVVIKSGVGAQVRAGETLQRDAADVTRQVGDWRGVHVSITQSGREPFTETKVSEAVADARLARWLGVTTGAPLVERARLQGVVGDPPFQISTTWIPPETMAEFPALMQVNTGPGGIYSRFEEKGHDLMFEESVTCRLPRAHEQEVLEIEASQPVLTTWRRCYDQRERIMEVTNKIIVGERHDVIYRFGGRP
ncbi:GntR family transcriptional regulator [Glycomyces buryatensis]|nr:GntR family transcriptional regulator [Glycomyces buryatensis]